LKGRLTIYAEYATSWIGVGTSLRVHPKLSAAADATISSANANEYAAKKTCS
jgi:hypothetical protein